MNASLHISEYIDTFRMYAKYTKSTYQTNFKQNLFCINCRKCIKQFKAAKPKTMHHFLYSEFHKIYFHFIDEI